MEEQVVDAHFPQQEREEIVHGPRVIPQEQRESEEQVVDSSAQQEREEIVHGPSVIQEPVVDSSAQQQPEEIVHGPLVIQELVVDSSAQQQREEIVHGPSVIQEQVEDSCAQQERLESVEQVVGSQVLAAALPAFVRPRGDWADLVDSSSDSDYEHEAHNGNVAADSAQDEALPRDALAELRAIGARDLNPELRALYNLTMLGLLVHKDREGGAALRSSAAGSDALADASDAELAEACLVAMARHADTPGSLGQGLLQAAIAVRQRHHDVAIACLDALRDECIRLHRARCMQPKNVVQVMAC